MSLQGVEAQSTSVLILVGNSFEGQSVGQVRLTRQAGASAKFYHVIISSNEFAGAPVGNAAIELDGGSDFVENIMVIGNIIQFTGVAIAASQAKGIHIANNILQAFDAGSIGIQTSAGATGDIGLNTFLKVTTPIANTAAGVIVA